MSLPQFRHYAPTLTPYQTLNIPKTNTKPKIVFCLPTRGILHHRYVFEVLFDICKKHEKWDCVFVSEFVHKHNVASARQICAERALERDSDYLLWIDDDQLFSNGVKPSQAIERLLAADVPIIGGLTRLKDEKFNYAAWRKSNDYLSQEEVSEGEILDIDGMGFGCALVKTEVFRELPKPWFDWGVCSDGRFGGDDSYFYRRAREAGYKIKLHTGVKLDHMAGELLILCDGGVRPI